MSESKTTRRRAIAGGLAMVAAATSQPGRTQEQGAGTRAFRAYEIGNQQGIASLRLAERTAAAPLGR